MHTNWTVEYILIILCVVKDVYSRTVSPFNFTSNTSTVESFTSITEEHATTTACGNENHTDSKYKSNAKPWYVLVIVIALCSMTSLICLRLYGRRRLQQQRCRALRNGNNHLCPVYSHNTANDDSPPPYEQCVSYTDPPPYDQLPPQYQMFASSKDTNNKDTNNKDANNKDALTPVTSHGRYS